MKAALSTCLHNVQERLALLDVAFDYTLGEKGQGITDTLKKERICEGFLIPLLEGGSSLEMSTFFCKTIKRVLNCLKLQESELEKMISMKMIAQLYTRADPNVVCGETKSNLTDIAFEVLSVSSGGEGKAKEKEMYKFLVKRLQVIRSDENQSFKVKCEAQNTLTALMTITKKDQKFYFTFLFKNVWPHIVDANEKWNFPLEFSKEDLPAKRREIVTIRKAISTSNENDQLFKPHFLADSSISQEITSFDFNDSIMSFEDQQSNATLENASVTSIVI
jgi:hypothetical protein